MEFKRQLAKVGTLLSAIVVFWGLCGRYRDGHHSQIKTCISLFYWRDLVFKCKPVENLNFPTDGQTDWPAAAKTTYLCKSHMSDERDEPHPCLRRCIWSASAVTRGDSCPCACVLLLASPPRTPPSPGSSRPASHPGPCARGPGWRWSAASGWCRWWSVRTKEREGGG